MIRSFLAIELPETLHEEIGRLISILAGEKADVKWVRPESVHLTVKFLGNTPEDLLEPLSAALAPIAAAKGPIPLGLSGLGFFPSPSKPRIIWVGLSGDLTRLGRLHKDVDSRTAEFGFPPETKPFRPHLTLGRFRSLKGREPLLAKVKELCPKPLSFTSSEIILFKSDLRPSGAVHTPLKRLPLIGAHLEENT